jgi:holo-[acyl-carrier protein] synthase
MAFSMRIGCDLISLPLFRASLASPGFEREAFTEDEIATCSAKHDRVASLAARFAAKEAFVKALGTGFFGSDRITPRDIWVQGAPRPEFGFSERVRNVMATLGFSTSDLSLAHHADYAMATVILS